MVYIVHLEKCLIATPRPTVYIQNVTQKSWATLNFYR